MKYKFCERPCNKCKYKKRIKGVYSSICTKRYSWMLVKVPWCKKKGINDFLTAIKNRHSHSGVL